MGAWKLTYVPSEPIPQKPISFTELSLLFYNKQAEFLKTKTDKMIQKVHRDIKQNPNTYDRDRMDESIKLLESLQETYKKIGQLNQDYKKELVRQHPQAHNLRYVLPL